MRRQTLSAIDGNSRQPRGSIGGAARRSMGAPASRASIPKKRSTSLSRRSSVMGKGSSKNSDPRPLNNKQYQQEEIRALITFLINNDFQERISTKILTQPTARDFQQIVKFLFKLIDPNYVPGKVEDDVPAVFKALGYPFGISKTSLTAVGSPHTWPSLLGSLSWMVELLEYDREVQQAEEERNANGDDDQAFFFNYLRDSYQAFLSGDDDAYDALDQQIAATFEEKYTSMENEMKELESHNEKLRKQIEEMKSAESSLPSLKQRKEDYESDLEKLTQAVKQREKNKTDMQNYRDSVQAKYNDKVEKKNYLVQRISEIKEIISTQEISPAGLESLRTRKQELSNEHEKLQEEQEDFRRQISENETQLSQNMDKAEEKVGHYKHYAKELTDIDRHNLQIEGSDVSEWPDFLQQQLVPALKSILTKIKKKSSSTSMEIIESKNNLDEKKEELQSKQQEIQDIERKSSQLEHDYSKEKATFDKHQHSHTDNMDTLEEQISAARERKLRNEELAREYDDAYIDTKEAEAESEKAKLKESEEAMQKKIDAAFGKLIKHRQRVDSRLEYVISTYKQEAEKVNGTDKLASSSASVFRNSQQAARPPPVQESETSFRFDLDASGEMDDEGLLYVDEAQ
eukprot:gb/GECG01010746.1/.p1 GENE.gb/GECG01010746.1/~~gb/GECG01010746.1/.p1  ORF type:complete len:630 (+),score=140.41 gb/GECG01010746.1/:1-1890(+)